MRSPLPIEYLTSQELCAVEAFLDSESMPKYIVLENQVSPLSTQISDTDFSMANPFSDKHGWWFGILFLTVMQRHPRRTSPNSGFSDDGHHH